LSPKITFEPVRVATDSDDEEGFLAFVDGRLAAVFVRLTSPEHKELRGLWYIEASFGLSVTEKPPTFQSMAAAQDWLLSVIAGTSRN
jgi:hypothetical protein